MSRLLPRLQLTVLAGLCLAVVGCPGGVIGTPVLQVSPGSISFSANSTDESLTIANTGGGTLNWTVREVRRIGEASDDTWEAADAPYFSLSSDDGTLSGGEITGSATTETDRIEVIAERADLPPGVYSGFGVEIETNGGVRRVPVSLNVESPLDISPLALGIAPNSNTANFVVRNQGGETLNFEIFALSDQTDPESIIDIPPFLSVPPTGSVPPGSAQTVVVTVDREGLEAAVYTTFLLVRTQSGEAIVTVTFGVGGASVFDVTPDALTIPVNVFGTGESAVAEFTISNPGETEFDWSLMFEDADIPGVPIGLPPFIQLSDISGSLGAGRDQVVTITVDPDGVDEAGITEINIFVNAEDVGEQFVTLRVIAIEGPRLSIQQLPAFRTVGLLDFGTEEDILTLGVGNTGGVGTQLDFTMSTDRPDLIKLPVPAGGQSIGRACLTIDYLFCHDWQQFPIVIDRAAMNPNAEVDGGEIFIEAPGQEPVTVAVAVTRAPLRIEGAQNRSRPPNVVRFVFILRDSLLEAIDTTNPDVLRNINFSIDEDGLPLELNETETFVSGPEGLKQNIVLLLDFTGSMFRAGEERGVPNGQFIEEMVDGAIEFIDDLPDSYRIAIMEYHEKDQNNREIHPFTTDKEALRMALENFSLAPANHGETEVYDAVNDAITALVDQDPAEIPFDDADVRAIVFVSDGNDTSSSLTAGEVMSNAVENRVRLYPVLFGDLVNIAPLTEMANESGGHAYNVIAPRTLPDFLGRPDIEGQVWHDLQRQIVLTYIALSDRDGTYRITASFLDDTGNTISGSFERDGIFFPGEPRAGQITLTTTGISDMGRADVFVRTDYVPRNISEFRFRFIIPPDFRDNLTSIQLATSRQDNGLLAGWRLLPGDDGVVFLVTEPENPLLFGSFGNLLRLRFDGLDVNDSFPIGFRVDNTLYARTDASPTVDTSYFVYPGSHTNPDEVLFVERASDIAPPSATIAGLQDSTFDPDALFAFDRDMDGVPDFDDPEPDNLETPGSLASPQLVRFPGSSTSATLTIRNNRLDTLEWSIVDDLASLPFSVMLSESSGILTPGASQTIDITVARTRPDGTPLAPGTYSTTLTIVSDVLLEPEMLTLTLEVPPQA